MTVRSNILRGAFGFEPPEIWSIVSPQARDFIQKLLVTEPKLRPTAREAQKHPWLKEWASKDKKADDNMLNPNVVKALVSFKEFSDMRKLLCEVLSFTLLPDQIRELRKEFEKMDTDGSGEISLQALKNVLLTEAGAGSLGALTESEVEDIFNAMRVSKTETRIHWHEFIAAGLSQCQVDDRNLRLAFDRLDSDHKGYITFDNVKDLMGNASMESEDAMQAMWGDSMKACQCKNARITYDDFILLMKGQTKETLQQISEHKVSEGESVLILPSGEKVVVTDEGTEFPSLKKSGSGSLRRLLGVGSAPSTPLYGAAVSSQIPPEIDMPVSMDEDDDVQITPEHSKGIFNNLTPPQSPERGAYDYITPFSAPKAKSPSPDADVLGLPMPEMPKRPPPYFRKRSRSVDDQESPNMNDSQGETPAFGNDARRAVMLPEHGYQREFENLIHDETKTTLVVNRQLYRAHRQMRIAVLEATKRFEEEQTRRAREILMAQKEEESNTDPPTTPVGGAGLVLRHGLKRQVSQEAVRKFLAKSKEETDVLMQKATKRGGRGRSRRQKTNSDMSGMLAGLSAELDQAKQELGASQSEIDSFAPFTVKEGTEAIMLPGSEELDANGEPVFPPIRNATVPGVFRRTKDPFGQGGRYNASS
jgi:Ca2+-binding EF-hand superfamily protein